MANILYSGIAKREWVGSDPTNVLTPLEMSVIPLNKYFDEIGVGAPCMLKIYSILLRTSTGEFNVLSRLLTHQRSK